MQSFLQQNGVVVGALPLFWIAFITVLFVLPPNELTGCIFGATLVGLGLFYVTRVHGRFKGPIPQASSKEELLKLEADFDRG